MLVLWFGASKMWGGYLNLADERNSIWTSFRSTKQRIFHPTAGEQCPFRDTQGSVCTVDFYSLKCVNTILVHSCAKSRLVIVDEAAAGT